MDDVLIPIAVCGMLFIGMPWLILHYVSKWKTNTPVMTGEDERLLDDMYTTARRLEERLETVERIIAADNPDFRSSAPTPSAQTDFDYARRN
jgi:phage shock protein B